MWGPLYSKTSIQTPCLQGLKSSHSWMSEPCFKQGTRTFGQSPSGSSYSSITLSGMVNQPESTAPTLQGKAAGMPALLPEEEPIGLDYPPQLFTDMLTAPSSSPLKGTFMPLQGHDMILASNFSSKARADLLDDVFESKFALGPKRYAKLPRGSALFCFTEVYEASICRQALQRRRRKSGKLHVFRLDSAAMQWIIVQIQSKKKKSNRQV